MTSGRSYQYDCVGKTTCNKGKTTVRRGYRAQKYYKDIKFMSYYIMIMHECGFRSDSMQENLLGGLLESLFKSIVGFEKEIYGIISRTPYLQSRVPNGMG